MRFKALYSNVSESPSDATEQGFFKVRNSQLIYGHKKNADGCIVVDIEAATIIKEIYSMALNGYSTPEICESLVNACYPTPREHIMLSFGNNIKPLCNWNSKNVRDILRKIEYTGALVTGATYKDTETGKCRKTTKDKWHITPDVYPVIISKEDYAEVRAISNNRANIQMKDYLLRRKVFCGGCGSAMSFERSNNFVYSCYRTLADTSASCHRFKVSVAELDDTVLTTIKKQAELIISIDNLGELKKGVVNSNHLTELKKQAEHLSSLRQDNYEKYITRVISKEAYHTQRADINSQLDSINSRIVMYTQAYEISLAKDKAVKNAYGVLDENATPKELVETLIDKIHVYPDNNIEITWKVMGFAVGI